MSTEIEALRNAIVNALYQVKCYDLPDACVSVGLGEGTSEEACRSKRGYVHSRIHDLDDEAIVALAGRVLDRHPDFDLEEALHLLHDASYARITDLTRRRLLELLGELNPIGGKLDNESFVARTGISKYALSQDPRFSTFWEDLLQHTVRNDDWSTTELLDRIGFLTCSEHRLFRFLEVCVHPLARTGEQQMSLASVINGVVSVDGVELAPVDAISGEPVYRVVLRRSGVAGTSKNIIFAAIGPKPEIIIRDAINNDIEIVKHEDKCLVYASPVPAGGLTWGRLVDWWAALTECTGDRKQVAKNLSVRLSRSLGSEAEGNFFRAYNRSAWARLKWDMPALIPQVYLHYDPYTARLRDQLKVVSRQRMDFLLLISPRERIVIEVDGVHHYSTGERPDTRKYAEMVAEDRALRLLGYEVFRFGGAELMDPAGSQMIVGEFVDRLFRGASSL